jgi:peptidyl-prolyl cis-trans isomerase C
VENPSYGTGVRAVRAGTTLAPAALVAAIPLLVVLSTVRPAAAADIAARVNGAPITETQVKDLTERIANSNPHGAPASREEALQSLIDMEVLSQQAKREHVEPPAAEVDQQLDQIKEHYPSPDAFQQALSANHTTETALRQEIAKNLAVQKLLDEHVAVKLPAGAAAAFYKANPDKFQHPAEVRASHILFRVGAGGDTAAAKKKAEAALQRLKKGEDFAKLARELSEDPGSAKQGGDLGFFPREAMVKPFADAAFGLKKGEMSGLVQTQFGFHIIKVTDTRAAGLTPLADVQARVEKYLDAQERAKRERAYVDALKKKAKIEVVAPKS